MSRIILVRHGQASFLEQNYDRLCATGEEQARRLGEFWARRGVVFHRAWTGPRQRQIETGRIVAEAYRRAGREFSELEIMSEFDEYCGEAVLKVGVPELSEKCERIRCLQQEFADAEEPAVRRHRFQKLFETVISKWVAGELNISDIESWPNFCARVNDGLAKAVNGGTRGGTHVIFTSGGPIGVAMQRALHLSHADTLQLTWMSRNTSFSEFLGSGERFTVSCFNSHPHLDDDSLLYR
ncbi:MAG TPA: histidine phosphatase family protein [Candidatus Sulfotelmatobacter sp.]|nr:histidine phosphatase family protein [Candidatus Sulfotelmatobacter sp.]